MKRRFSQVQDEPVLRLQLADDGSDNPPLEACMRLLHTSCSCAFNLPRDSGTWDLSNLLIDGHAVSRDTVTAWLNVVYTLLEDTPFQEGMPTAAASATRLYQLLAFADAVGSSRGVVKACLAGLEQLAFEVKVGDKEVQLAAGPRYVWIGSQLSTCEDKGYACIAETAGNDQRQSCTQQLVSQLEPLLYLAYRLQLAPLQEVLHAFIRGCTSMTFGVLMGHMRSVLTQRVTAAAAEEGLMEGGLLQLLVAQRCSLTGREDGLFQPVDAGFKPPVISFKAKVQRWLPGVAVGEVVDVMLDLKSGRLTTNGWGHRVQLLVGLPVSTPASKSYALGEQEAVAGTTT